jgi:hypothetical protein
MAKLPIAGLGVLVLRVQGAREGHVDGERVGRLAVVGGAGVVGLATAIFNRRPRGAGFSLRVETRWLRIGSEQWRK